MNLALRAAVLLAMPCLSAPFAAAQKTPDVLVSTGPAPGGSAALRSAIAASQSSVHIAWQNGDGSAMADVLYNRSLDGGLTWLPTPPRLNSGTAGMAFNPCIAAAGSLVCVAWQTVPANRAVYLNRSLDGGATWLGPVALPNPSGAGATTPRIATDGTSIQLIWNDANGVFCTTSSDAGATWLPAPVRVSHGPSTFNVDVQMVASGTDIFAIWIDYAANFVTSVEFNASTDGGRTWGPVDTTINHATTAYPLDARLAVSGTAVLVCWQDWRFSNPYNSDIFFNASLDGGATWNGTDTQLSVGRPPAASTTDGSMTYPMIAASGSMVCVGWTENRNHATRRDVYATASTDLGQTWSAETRVNTGVAAGTVEAFEVQMAMDGPEVTVAWSDDRYSSSGTSSIHANKSLDGGRSWRPSDVRLDVGAAPGPTVDNTNVRLAAAGGSVYATWIDTRTSVPEVFFNLARGSQPYGTGTAGAGNRIPSLRGSGHATPGGTIGLDFANAVGGAPGLVAAGVGAGGRTSRPLLGGTLLVNPAATQVFLCGGTFGVPGAGDCSLPVVVPNVPAMLGFCLDVQGLILDPGATQGVSMSNGLQVWIG